MESPRPVPLPTVFPEVFGTMGVSAFMAHHRRTPRRISSSASDNGSK